MAHFAVFLPRRSRSRWLVTLEIEDTDNSFFKEQLRERKASRKALFDKVAPWVAVAG